MRRSPLLTSSILLARGCGGPEMGPADGGEGWEQEYGRTPPMYEGDASQEVAPPLGKADGAGRLGPHVRWNKGEARVWEVTRGWGDVEPEAGLAWARDSGLNWEEKYSAWVASLPELDTGHGRTFELVTPHKRLPAPVLECAEVAIFLRTAFASWHGLPFFLEARDGGKPIYIGDTNHFSHRLVRMGMSTRRAVLTMYLMTFCSGLGAALLYQVSELGAVLIMLQTVLILVLVGLLEHESRAGRERMQPNDEQERPQESETPAARSAAQADPRETS